MALTDQIHRWSRQGRQAVVIQITSVAGSAPREPGATMAVSATDVAGTIGGGALEDLAIKNARAMLNTEQTEQMIDQPLGPDIGQCCGGRVMLRLRRAEGEVLDHLRHSENLATAQSPAVYVFGAGHTGTALARVLATLPFSVTVIDQRAKWLNGCRAHGAVVETPLPEAEVARAPAGSAFVIMTHSHALDFLIAEAALARGDAAYVGMIGSASKRARLISTLNAKCVATEGLTCPIGATGAKDKRPEVIAALTAAEIASVLL